MLMDSRALWGKCPRITIPFRSSCEAQKCCPGLQSEEYHVLKHDKENGDG